jgi:hypothetical protein
MPSAVRAQVALVGLLAVLLIPIGTSSLRGLTHILTCQEQSATPFSVTVLEDAPPMVLSAAAIRPGVDGSGTTLELCGGLTLDVRMGTERQERAELTLAITNGSDFGWRGSVRLDLGGTAIPVDIGHVDPGETASETFEVRLDPGRTYEVAGSLLVGP